MAQSSRIERQITNLIRNAVDPDHLDASGDGITGTPDLASRYAKVAVFVDGCHWHGCPEHGKNDEQAAKRRARDDSVNTRLTTQGWAVFRVWEHEEHLAPFIATAAQAISQRAAHRRKKVTAHIASHDPGEWCGPCDQWPHQSVTRDDGWCERCMIHEQDHEWDASDWKLFGPPDA
ncbi:hypothetical protein [Streptomyces noursei]|uniref:hypothetical protein n=1 Tax=Streptomyces noursei TaxID=1971 RepID=UPI00167736FF|nr:hypothetical protein [Streptomyces noursei]MCZ1014014.1 hypothetical protein [Streptomyces noursei]GGX49195.1 hypothetical protein GCM10010341_83550 [Streptomyces noursei]